jgi:hypothetical protein
MPTPRRLPQPASRRLADRPTGAPAGAAAGTRTRRPQPELPRPPAPRGYSPARVRELPPRYAQNDPADETW